ncbi:hypothetical protein AGMMS50276_31610 [Synergistales bacterium]|nr:hypothetical protein AGMMS50276_31610 [Synergistales bacterium]
MNTQSIKKYLTAKELSEQLGLCRASLYNLMRRGELPQCHKFGRASRWLQSDIDAWAQSTPRGAYGEN